MAPNLDTIIQETLAGHVQLKNVVGDPAAMIATFQWPWDIAKAGANHLNTHGSAINALVDSGQKIINSPSGAGIVSAVSREPTNPANTDQVLNNGLFTNALNSVKADQLLRTVFIGFASGAEIGLVGGGGGTGIAYDIINNANRASVSYGSFNLGLGGQINVGLILGAMTAEPENLNESTCVWQFGAAIVAVSVLVSVIMKSSDLSLIGFGLNLAGGAGISSATGYGTISAVKT